VELVEVVEVIGIKRKEGIVSRADCEPHKEK
jgi:hypothetical protein